VIITLIVFGILLVIGFVVLFGWLCHEYGFSKAVWMLIDVKNSEGWSWAHFLRAERKEKDKKPDDKK
jgi:hypothetical protein